MATSLSTSVSRSVSSGIGRLVAPDEGSGLDDEPDSVAYDAGAAGGGPSAEELAIHETRAPGYD